jgi:HSP20 family protein
MLMRFDPFRDLDRLTQNLWGSGDVRRLNAVPMDAYRKGSEFVVHFDVPGINPDSIELTVEKNVLTVSAERTRHWGEEAEEVVVAERPVGSFSRQLFLGETLDSERIEASCDNGVLTLRIPVAEAAKPRKVSISSGAGNGSQSAIQATSTSN